MTDAWRSQERVRCIYCDVWYVNNRAQRELHEGGLKHQERKQTLLRDIAKRNEQEREQKRRRFTQLGVEQGLLNDDVEFAQWRAQRRETGVEDALELAERRKKEVAEQKRPFQEKEAGEENKLDPGGEEEEGKGVDGLGHWVAVVDENERIWIEEDGIVGEDRSCERKGYVGAEDLADEEEAAAVEEGRRRNLHLGRAEVGLTPHRKGIAEQRKRKLRKKLL